MISEALGQDQGWIKLLHYKNNISTADGPLFFLSDEGKYNPKVELKKNIELLPQEKLTGGHFNHPLACVFIARVHYLKKNGLWNNKAPNIKCPDFEEWKKNIKGENSKVFLSFSTAYPNNPASAFGHTFLRFQKGDTPHDLLDYTVAISAEVPSQINGLLYALKGLTGGFKSFIDIAPFFQKIQEYNHSENRDLYEFPLNLNSDEIDFLLEHIWEIYSTTWFDYYFLDKNCSSLLGEILEIIRPEVSLLNSRFYYLPSDLVKNLIKNKLIGPSVHVPFRPGAKKRWKYLYQNLNKKDKIEFQEHLKQNKISDKKEILDLSLLMLNIEQHRSKNNLSETQTNLFKKTLLARSQIKEKSLEVLAISQYNRPDFSHEPSKISLETTSFSFPNQKNEWENTVHLKLGHHDQLDFQKGYEPFSRFDFLGLSLSHFLRAQKVKITEIKGIYVYSATPLDLVHKQASWKAQAHITQAIDSDCFDCLAPQGEAMIGTAFFLNQDFTFVPLFGAFANSGKAYKKGFKIGPVIELIQWVKIKNWQMGLKANLWRDYFSEKRLWGKIELESSWPILGPLYELRFKTQILTKEIEDSWFRHLSATSLNFAWRF